MEIVKSNWGIANTFNDRIEINKNLDDFPGLKQKIIHHEMEHSRTKGFIANRKVDALTELKFKDIFPFVKKYPKAFFQQYIPISYSKVDNTLYFEWSLITLYFIFLGMGYLIYRLILFFSMDSAFSFIILRNIIIIFGVILGLYILGKFLKKYTSGIDWNEGENKLTNEQKKLKKLGIKS